MFIEAYIQPPELIIHTGFRCWTITITPTRWKFRFDTYWDDSKWISIGPIHLAGYFRKKEER